MIYLVAILVFVGVALVAKKVFGVPERSSRPSVVPGDVRNRAAQYREWANEFPLDPTGGEWSLKRNDFGHGFAFVLVSPSGDERPLKSEGRWDEGFKSTEIVGEKNYLKELHDSAFMSGREVRLVLEPDNPYDSEAVSIRSLDERLTVGYLSRKSRAKPKVLELIRGETPPRTFVQWRSATRDGEVARLRVLITLPDTTFRKML